MKPKCVITLDLPEDIVAPLERHYDVMAWAKADAMPEAYLREWLGDARGLLCALSTPITASVLAGAEQLKVISTISVGVDHIDLAAATAAGIPVGHTPGVLVDSTADLAVGLMIATTRRIAEADRWMRTGQWSKGWQSDLLLGSDLSQATVGIVGLGPIGEATVKRLRGFGCGILGWNRTRSLRVSKWWISTTCSRVVTSSLFTPRSHQTRSRSPAGAAWRACAPVPRSSTRVAVR